MEKKNRYNDEENVASCGQCQADIASGAKIKRCEHRWGTDRIEDTRRAIWMLQDLGVGQEARHAISHLKASKEMTREEMIEAINAMQPEMVNKVYSGRPGCGCGCKGKYFEDERNIKRVLKAMWENAADAKRVDFNEDSAAVEGDRYYWAFLETDEEKVKAAVKATALRREQAFQQEQLKKEAQAEARGRRFEAHTCTALAILEDIQSHVHRFEEYHQTVTQTELKRMKSALEAMNKAEVLLGTL